MTTPSYPQCPDHGGLVRELLLGRLPASWEARAEALVDRCPACREVLVSLEEGLTPVSEGVAEGFGAVSIPRRQRVLVRRLGVAAAALAFLFGAHATRVVLRPSPPAEPAVSGEVIFQDGMESGNLAAWSGGTSAAPEPARIGSTTDRASNR